MPTRQAALSPGCADFYRLVMACKVVACYLSFLLLSRDDVLLTLGRIRWHSELHVGSHNVRTGAVTVLDSHSQTI